MKKKFLIKITAIVCALCCLFGFTACDVVEELPHTHNYQWVDNGDGTHKQHCTNEGCDAPDINVGSHDFSNGNCVCGKQKPADEHTHTWSSAYQKDETHHWFNCTATGCTEKKDYAPHDFTNGNCVCGQIKPVTHTHDYQWVDNGDGTHKQHCANEGCDAPDINVGSHDFSDGDCVCGKIKTTEGLAYELNADGESYCVMGIGTAQTTSLVIPEEYEGKPVTSVYDGAFKGCDFTRVVIPNSVTKIGFAAFVACEELTYISLPFTGAEPDSEEIPHFGYIFGATVAEFESQYNYVPSSLKTVEITGGESIVGVAFYLCQDIENVILHDGLKSIGNYAFGGCYKLKGIEIPNGVTRIEEGAFLECAELTEVIIPDSITFVDENAFAFCEELQYNEYDNALYLGNAENPYVVLMRYTIDNITSCEINENVKCILKKAFSHCSYLESLTLDEDNTAYTVYDGILYNKDKTELIYVPYAIGGEREVPYGITTIGSDDFSYRQNLVGITIPNSVTTIEQRAFYGCKSLESMSLPFVGIKVSGTSNMCFGYLFGNNESNVDVPPTIHTVKITGDGYIGGSAFNGCTYINTVIISGKISSIGNLAFYNCGTLDIIFNGTRAEWNSISKGNEWNIHTDYTIHLSDGDTITANG